jgi:hypothetical protein
MKLTYNDGISIVVHSDNSINTYAVVSCNSIDFYVDSHIPPKPGEVNKVSTKSLEETTIADLLLIKAVLDALELEESTAMIRGRDF